MDEYLDTLISENRIGENMIYHVLGRGASIITKTFLDMSKEEFDALISIINITGGNTVFIIGATYDIRIDVKGQYCVTLLTGVTRLKDSRYASATPIELEHMWYCIKGLISYVEQ